MKNLWFIFIVICFCSCELPQKESNEQKTYYEYKPLHNNLVIKLFNEYSYDFPMWNSSKILTDGLKYEFEDSIMENPNFLKMLLDNSYVDFPWYENISNDRRIYRMIYEVELDRPLENRTKIFPIVFEITTKYNKRNKNLFPEIPKKYIIKKVNRRYNYGDELYFGSYEIIEC